MGAPILGASLRSRFGSRKHDIITFRLGDINLKVVSKIIKAIVFIAIAIIIFNRVVPLILNEEKNDNKYTLEKGITSIYRKTYGDFKVASSMVGDNMWSFSIMPEEYFEEHNPEIPGEFSIRPFGIEIMYCQNEFTNIIVMILQEKHPNKNVKELIKANNFGCKYEEYFVEDEELTISTHEILRDVFTKEEYLKNAYLRSKNVSL